ncbi:MAG: hypothetical protein PHP32_00405 [Candidatus Izemoplasmatales bacterium]|nr:hypothetical protein [Candidatus Izemoplasmatales bacterium]
MKRILIHACFLIASSMTMMGSIIIMSLESDSFFYNFSGFMFLFSGLIWLISFIVLVGELIKNPRYKDSIDSQE